MPWLRDNYGHSSTRGGESCSTIYWPERAHRRAARAIRHPENMVLGWREWTRMAGTLKDLECIVHRRLWGEAMTALKYAKAKAAKKK